MSCLPPGRKSEPEPEPEPGFFASLFGFGRSDAAKCKNCTKEPCACANSELRAHLKDCCQLGTLPEPYKCPSPKSKSDKGNSKASTANDAAKRVEGDCSCVPVYKSNWDDDDGDMCSQFERERQAKKLEREGGKNGSEKNKCPPFPKTDTKTCIPKFLCKPGPTDQKVYPVPPGEIILPISAFLRMASPKSNKCTECGRHNDPPEIPEPNVSIKDCPAMRVDCRSKSVQRLSDNGCGEKTQESSLSSGAIQQNQDPCQKAATACRPPPPVSQCELSAPTSVPACARGPSAEAACPPNCVTVCVPICVPVCAPSSSSAVPACAPKCEPPRGNNYECPPEEVLEDCSGEEEIPIETECEEDEGYIEEDEASCDCGGDGEEEFVEEEYVEEETEGGFEEEECGCEEDADFQEVVCPPCPACPPCPRFQQENSCGQLNMCQGRVEDPCSKNGTVCGGTPNERPSQDNCSYSPKPLSFNNNCSNDNLK